MSGAIEAQGGPTREPQRFVAVVLPDLLCELAGASLVAGSAPRAAIAGAKHGSESAEVSRARSAPLGVLLAHAKTQNSGVLAAVNDAAKRCGVRVGQTVAEANAFLSHLVVREVTHEQIQKRLGEIAEVALGFGPTVAIEAPDTVWVDVTGAAHLSGGENALLFELAARVRALGHLAKVAVSNGPRLAQSFARWGPVNREGCLVVPANETALRVRALPVHALPIDAERTTWLVRLGVLTVGDLARLPRSAAASRLADDAGRVLDLAEGRDDSPLDAYVPPSLPCEAITWDEPASGSEPLLFVLRGLVSRLGARLEGRGEAVQALDLVVMHDRSMARLEGASPETVLRFELSAPLWRGEELYRVIASRLGRAELRAPSVGLRLEARAVTRALTLQLSLSRYAAGLGGNPSRGPETLAIVLAELISDLGKDKVGLLKLEGSHRPEKKSRLVPVTPSLLAPRPAVSELAPPGEADAAKAVPTRLLSRPIPFDAPLRPGATVSVEHRLYSVERVTFEHRVAGVEWWTGQPVSRDYVRAWLGGRSSGLEVVVYVDRSTGERKIQAICD